MLFNSYLFILLFFPTVAILFFRIGAIGHHRIAVAWLVAASLFFYGWWNPAYLGLMLFSILFNYSFGVFLSSRRSKPALTIGVLSNIALLAYFKYANFAVETFNHFLKKDIYIDNIILPLAISFFTFQQIAYLVDAYRGETREYNFLHYCLFVTFFPQLIAGPIVHHREMLPQFAKKDIYTLKWENIAVGLTIFSIGLFKKVIIADGLSRYANMAFGAASDGVYLTFFEAWRGALFYTFQLYFDFSGYSDMAIGLARVFGIILPINFFSPYRAHNIIDFWRRWHMTLSRFLRDYLYIPLGGNRKGPMRRHVNLMITMVLGGLWHGAGWTFVVWGGIHGLLLVVNHGWHALGRAFDHGLNKGSAAWLWFSRGLTFLAVTVGWVFFRAQDIDTALLMLGGMVGNYGLVWPGDVLDVAGEGGQFLSAVGVDFAPLKFFKGGRDIIIMSLLLFVVWFVPNTQQIMGPYHPSSERLATEKQMLLRLAWKPNHIWLGVTALILIISILKLSEVSEFLYFQF